jgi:hypothetical protein
VAAAEGGEAAKGAEVTRLEAEPGRYCPPPDLLPAVSPTQLYLSVLFFKSNDGNPQVQFS